MKFGNEKITTTVKIRNEEIKTVFFLFKYLKNTTKDITKNTSIKNRYCAEKNKTKILFINIEIQIKLMILFFLMIENIIKPIKLKINKILIIDFIPFNESQFLIYSNRENFEISV